MEKADKYQKFISEKAKKKRDIMGKMFFPRTPILLLDFSNGKINSEFEDLLSGLKAMKVQTLVVVKNPKSEEKNSSIQYISPTLKNDALEAADIVVVFEHDEVKQMRNVGCVPVAQLDGDGTVDYNPLKEQGNGFYFKNPTKWEIFAAIVRALETYQFPYDWENLIREILK